MPWPTVSTLRSLDQLDKVTAVTYDAGGNQLTVRDPNNVGADIVHEVMSNYGFTAAGTTYDFEDRLTGFQRAATSGPAQTLTHGPTHELPVASP
jgi:hypothetical protein